MSWNPEVIADSSGKWCGNGLFFATEEEAKQYVYDLAMRWFAVRDTRATESKEPVNYTYHDRKLRAVAEPEGIKVTVTRMNEVAPGQGDMFDDK